MATTNTVSIEKVSDSIEAAIQGCGVSAIADLSHIKQAVRMAQGLRALRAALTDDFVREVLMPLQGSKLGFLTDKDRDDNGGPGPGYPLTVVRDCVTVAMIHGFNVVGNEFNIIAGNFYGTQAGFDRKVREFPGLSHFVEQPGVPHLHQEKGALVPYVASWRLNGKAQSIECVLTKDGDTVFDNRIPVTVNRRMGVDAIVGKALRKLLYRIYKRLNGGAYGLGEGEVGDMEALITTGEAAPAPALVTAGAPDGKRVKMGGSASKPAPAAAPAAATAAAPAAEQTLTGNAPPVDVTALHDALGQVDKDWLDPATLSIVEGWTEPLRRSAMEWVMACLMDGPMAIQSARPEHTRLAVRVSGEEG